MTTNEFGKFKHGPVAIDNYLVNIALDDYTFTRIDETSSTYDFRAQRAASLEIRAIDAEGTPLEEVFVTVSAGKNILKGQTDVDGVLKFPKIEAQKYYLTALMKEYSFGSGAQAIQIDDEQLKVVTVTGERIAFSIYGRVGTLQGLPVT